MEPLLKKIIIFDDDEDILAICSYILQELNWQVHTFSDCCNVAERVKAIMPNAILMDNWIPDTGGVIATQRLKNEPELKNIPVIYFSANSDIRSLAEIAGAEAYLEKPFEFDDLTAMLEKF